MKARAGQGRYRQEIQLAASLYFCWPAFAVFSFNGRKFPSSQQATKLSVTVLSSSQRARMLVASFWVIWLSAAALAITASKSANSCTISLVAGIKYDGCGLFNFGFRIKKPPARW